MERNKSATFYWSCPRPQPFNAEQRLRLALILEAGTNIANTIKSPIAAAGLEVRVAMLLIDDLIQASEPDNSFWLSKCRRLLLRPSIEPIIFSYWVELMEGNVDERTALDLASALAGHKLALRDHVIGRSAFGNVAFEDADKARSWILDITTVHNHADARIVSPIYNFARVIMAHPFADCNGRIARVFSHAALAQLCGVSFPIVAISPSIYRRALTLTNALNILSTSGNWHSLTEALLDVYVEAIFLTRVAL